MISKMIEEKVILDKTPTKICTQCGRELPATLEYFKKGKPKNKFGLYAKCKDCSNNYSKHWRETNRERHRDMSKDWRERNREHTKEYKSKYNEEHKEQIKEYRDSNRFKIMQVKREYYIRNKDKILQRNKDWRANNKDKMRVYRLRYKAKASEDSLCYDDWINCLDYFNNSCAYCGKKTLNLHGDHVVPISKGGKTTKYNIICACAHCNLSKKNNDMEFWFRSTSHFSEERLLKIKNFITRRESDWNDETRENSINNKKRR